MPTLGHDSIKAIITAHEAPCVSVYLPTHRHHPDNAQDPIQFKNLVKQVEESLRRAYPGREVRSLLEPLHQLQADSNFWNHTLDGLAVLASANRFDVYKMARTMPQRVVVADSFHIKPLLRFVQSADRFHVLAVSREKIALFEGNRDSLDMIPMPELTPRTRPAASADPGALPVFNEGAEGFFRAIDQAVNDEVSKPTGTPLLLVGMSENLATFRSVAKNPRLLPDAVAIDPFSLDTAALRTRVWSVIETSYLARLAKLSQDFGTAVSRQQATGDLSDAARAAVAGRVATLLIDADQTQPGAIDPVTGAIKSQDQADPSIDDKLDDLAEIVLRQGGDVVVVPGNRMPTQSGLAAIFRF